LTEGGILDPVFKIRLLKDDARTCRIFAEIGSERVETQVDTLESNFKDQVDSLQKALSQTAATRDVGVRFAPNAGSRNLRAWRTEPQSAAGQQEIALDPPNRAEFQILQQIGARLFDFLFQKEVFALYRDSLRAAQGKYPLRVKLLIDAPEFSAIPWETLYERKTRSYLSCSRDTPFSRTVSMDDDNRSIAQELPIRILVMAAKPRDVMGVALDKIDADAEQNIITNALKSLEDQNMIKLGWTTFGSRRDLVNRIAVQEETGEPAWHVFHFIGHGGFDPDRGDKGMGFIVLQEEGGTHGKVLYAENLKDILVGPHQPQLVILNSCNGAFLGSDDLFSSTAAALVLGGIPAVIAMQFAISDEAALAFSRSLYSYLAAGLSIQKALTLTRIDLRADEYAEWIAPVLYMRTPDGELIRKAEQNQ
jgi:hypothetical protein